MNNIEKCVKRQIRMAIANEEKINNLNHVSQQKIDKAYEEKELYNYRIMQKTLENNEVYFAFIEKTTGYYYNSTILKCE